MICYAIRHKPTGGTLPVHRRGRAAGYTYDEPCTNEVPRLFLRRSTANVALRCWLEGHWSQHYDFDGVVIGYKKNVAKIPRIAEDMEVVPVRLTIGEFNELACC